MSKSIKKSISFLLALFIIIQTIKPDFTASADKIDVNTIKLDDSLKKDDLTYLSIEKAQQLYDLSNKESDNNKFNIGLGIDKNTREFRLIIRDELKLYEDGYFENESQAQEEYNRVKENLNSQGLDISISVIKDENGYRIVNDSAYEEIVDGKEEKPYGPYYSYIDFKVLDDFDFSKNGYSQYEKDKNKLAFNLEFARYESLDPSFNLFQMGEDASINIKNDGQIFATISDNKLYIYDTNSLKNDYDKLKQYQLEKENKEESKEESKTEVVKEDNNSSNETKENTDKENSTSTPSKEVIKFENDSDTYSSLNRTSSNPDVKKRAKRSLFSLYSNENYKFEIYKYDEEDNSPLEGAEFELQSTDGNFKNIYSSDSNGKVFIDNLKSGTYSLVEKTAPLGYQKISKKWTVFVNSQGKVFISELGELAEDPQIQYRSNLTDNIKILNSSEIKSTNPVNTSNDTNKFTIDLDLQLNTSAKEGDYFTLDVSDTLHYNMIQPDKLNYPNILTADGVILAYPVINPSFDIERGTNKKISYVFTNAIEGLQSVDMKLHLEHSVNVNVAYYNRDYDFYVGIGDQTLSKRVSVVHTNVSVGKNNISNIKAAYEYVNDQNGRYVQLAYINPLSRNISGQAQIQVYPASSNSQYINTANLSDEKTTIKLYKFVGNSLPDAVIMHHSQFEEVNPSSYTVRYDYSFATPTAIIDIKNNIGTSTYLLRVESELDLDVQNPDRKPQGPIQTIVFSKGGDATSPKDVIGKTNAILVQGSSASGSGDYEKPILKVPNKKQIGEFKVIKKVIS